jgi:hypothetical protein
MAVAYFKRYRMEIRADRLAFPATNDLPGGFRMVPWADSLINHHADVKWMSFREEIDVHVFPCLGQRDGCRNLMREIANRKDFVPEATWLVARDNPADGALQPCGTIQGLRSGAREGAIQNIGVHPECRDLGLGRALLSKSLAGFLQAGCRFVHLEVTVENTAAIRLYERLGFRRVETLFKVAEVQLA